jgi:regulator of protease activity HflC (stomatin/prohibitin superfamily)
MFMFGPQAGVRRGPFLKVVIFEFQRGMLYRRGRFARVLEPGRYWLRARDTLVRVIDVRPAFVTIPGQEVLSADGITLKVSVAAQYEVADLDVAFNRTADATAALYLTLQMALREIVGTTKIEELLENRSQFAERLVQIAAESIAALGLRLLAADIKDIMFPGELKRIFAQVVQAKQEGLAALEKARGETAALRNLGNAARAVQENPALLQLRMLQAVAGQPGSTLVVGVPQALPVPANAAESERPRNAE